MSMEKERPMNKMPWLVPHITVKDVDSACDFYTNVLCFRKKGSSLGKDGTTWNAELQYKDQVILLDKEGTPGKLSKSPNSLQVVSPMNLYIYCENVDTIYQQASGAGAQIRQEPTDMPWGDRICIISDLDGYYWVIATCKTPPQATVSK
jgi:PhnB protein